MKKYLAILLTAALLLCAAPLAGFTAIDWPEWDFSGLFPSAKAAEIVTSGNCGEVNEEKGLDGSQVTWTLDSDGVLTITGSGRMQDYSTTYSDGRIHTSAPWDYRRVKTVVIKNGVSAIGGHAFAGCEDLTSVTIAEGVTEIGHGAFYSCGSLSEITFPGSLTNIGIQTFAQCGSLTKITIPNGVTEISDSMFSFCKELTEVVLPAHLTSIGNQAFYDCTSLTSVTIPVGVAEIDDNAFEGCRALTEMILPAGLTSIGYGAFRMCHNLTDITIPDSVEIIGSSAFEYTPWYDKQPDGLIYIGKIAYEYKGTMPEQTALVLKEGTKKVAASLFRDQAELTSIVLPDGLTSIENGAFNGCTGLKSVSIPGSVTSIGGSAFSGCTGLREIALPDGLTTIKSGLFADCTGLARVSIPDNVSIIEQSAFRNCSGLSEITLPDGLTTIEYYAFGGCTSLTSIFIPESVTSIDGDAFSGTAWYDNQPDGVVYVGRLAYSYKGKMPQNTTISLKEGIKGIASSAFRDCTGLTAITIPDSVTEIGGSAFSGCFRLSEITIPNGVTEIGYGAFSSCGSLSEITIPEGVTSVNLAFSDCKRLKSVNLPDTVTEIMYAFRGCSSLASIRIPAKLKSFYSYDFAGCTSLTEIFVSEKNPVYYADGNCVIQKKDNEMVFGCKNSIIPADGSVTAIMRGAFSGCAELKQITIPEGVTEVGHAAFSGCVGLTDVTLPDSVTSIGTQAFSGCRNLRKINIPDSVTSIAAESFFGCSNLVSVTIPAGIKSFSPNATFQGCSGLAELSVSENNPVYFGGGNCVIQKENKTLVFGCKNSVIPADGSVTSIGNAAFFDCNGLTSVTIPDSVTNIGSSAFSGCAGLTSIILPQSVTKIDNNATPKHTVIYGSVGSYAQQWAEENSRAFVPIGDAAVTLNAPEVVNEPYVNVFGFANPGAEVVCFVNETETITVQASANGRWNAEIPLTGAKDRDDFIIKATVTVDGKTAEQTATVTYKPDAILLDELTLNHSYYSLTIKGERLGVSLPNFTFVPGKPLAFKIKVTNTDRIKTLFVVSTKDGASKQMALTYNKATGFWFADGFFDEADQNYVPGVFTVRGVDKDGKAFDCGVTIKINFLIDPSGYAYEAVPSNKLEGVTAAVYYKDAEGHELLWNAETADQINPVTTLPDGAFAWVVPEGQWQVRLTKPGYLEARSEWMDVPPEQTNVYIPMVSSNAPEVAYCNVYADRAEITFSQYMEIESVNMNSVKFNGYTGTIAPIDKTETASGSGVFYAKAFTFTPEKAFSGEVAVAVANAKNYAGKEMASPYSATFTVAAEPKNLTATQDVSAVYGKTAEVTVSAENAAGKTVSVACDSANVTLSDKTLTLDETGKATLSVTGEMPGVANLTFALDGTTLKAAAKVSVTVPEVPAEPEQPTDPENPATPTDPENPATPTDPEGPDQPTYALGDVDGDGEVTSGDARLALRASVQLEKYEPGSAAFLAADADKNGEIESSDARTILRVSVKLETF